MGYTTEFKGQIEIDPPLSAERMSYINKFSETRRMKRNAQMLQNKFGGNFGFNNQYGLEGEFFVGGSGFGGQDNDETVVDHNTPPQTQPGLWCQWIITEDGKYIEWDECEKFYDSPEWMKYIIDKFIADAHTCNGIIHAFGEDRDDVWDLIVTDNIVTTR